MLKDGVPTMAEIASTDLRVLAVRIATSYTRANATSVDALPNIIQLAYRGLQQCVAPPPPPEKPVVRTGRPGRPRKQR